MKPTIPKGTRDFLPEEIKKRNYIFGHIKTVFRKYGFAEIETPSMETLSTLTGKYGEEGDRLLFKILNNGDFLSKADDEALLAKNSSKLIPSIAKRGLRYDLTVPFARYVVMHQNEIQLPFKRFQIQPVWRADRPQKGRYQEFYQCDADMVGSDSLMYEAELVLLTDEVFSRLNIPVEIKINNRKLLYGMAEYAGVHDRFIPFTVAIDKLDKIGIEKVLAEMERNGFSQNEIEKINEILKVEDLTLIKEFLEVSETGKKGVAELESVTRYLDEAELVNNVVIDPKLARGLNYYTGCIFEVQATNVVMGSIAGGGRYDDLTGSFGLNGVSGVGISFGAERIYDIMSSGELFPSDLEKDVTTIILAMDEETHIYAFSVAAELRKEGIYTDVYPEPVKMRKQLKYAHTRNIPYAIIIGSEEHSSGNLSIKNLGTGEQEMLSVDMIIKKLKN